MRLTSFLLVVACVVASVSAQFGQRVGFMARRGWGGGRYRHQPYTWGSQLAYRGDDDSNWYLRRGRQAGHRWGGGRTNFRYGQDDWDSRWSDSNDRGRWGDDNRRWWRSDDNRRWGDDNRRWGDDNRRWGDDNRRWGDDNNRRGWRSDDYGRRGWGTRSGSRWGQQWSRPTTHSTQYTYSTNSDDGRGWSRSDDNYGWQSDDYGRSGDDNIFAYRSRVGGYRGVVPRGNYFNNLYYTRD